MNNCIVIVHLNLSSIDADILNDVMSKMASGVLR